MIVLTLPPTKKKRYIYIYIMEKEEKIEFLGFVELVTSEKPQLDVNNTDGKSTKLGVALIMTE